MTCQSFAKLFFDYIETELYILNEQSFYSHMRNPLIFLFLYSVSFAIWAEDNIIPAVIIAVMFQGSGLSRLLIFSQIVLSLQLPFAILPLVYLTSSKKHMGDFANKLWLKIVVGLIAAVIVALNVWLIVRVFAGE